MNNFEPKSKEDFFSSLFRHQAPFPPGSGPPLSPVLKKGSNDLKIPKYEIQINIPKIKCSIMVSTSASPPQPSISPPAGSAELALQPRHLLLDCVRENEFKADRTRC